ncbi:MAG: efflux RND transporter periplasmic adaptor subunit [Bacteroidales bacterium]|nr:efflux RND transporter periplasmic adaptor subunit [Candidatus Physcousia equi]
MKRVIVNALLAMVLLVSCQSKQDYQVEPLKVETERVGEGNSLVARGRSYVGTIEEEESVSMSFTGMGTLKRVLVSEGQMVSKGQLLAELDDTQSRNILDAMKATVGQAEDAIARYKQLHDKGSLPDAKWVEAQSKLEEARASLRGAEKNLADCRLVASMSGIVGARQANAGATVLPSQPIVSIYKINNVKVRVSVPEAEIAQITATTPSRIEVPAVRLDLAGGSVEKGIVADAMTHTYNIRINLSNPQQKLLPGMVCHVTLGDDKAGDAADAEAPSTIYTLPVRCIQQAADGQHFVWVVDADKKAHRQDITLGNLVGNRMEVCSGLKAGQQVITAGYQKVSEGSCCKL